ncbi:uncharacterized protein [Lolium perenne]|uniref:uncharacterized protein isoform X1 n=1 Tax=Lolium perenne TaxID=4522 RepID=UPI003A9A1F86
MGYYRRAAELGHPVGMCNLGVSYLEADPPEAKEAVRWFYPAASAGNVRAQYNLGLCLQNGKGIKRNQREAAKWYLRAAEGGNVRAMYNVSLCYCLGEGFTQDHMRAKKWLQLAADCGHKKALYECGLKLCALLNDCEHDSGANKNGYRHYDFRRVSFLHISSIRSARRHVNRRRTVEESMRLQWRK